MSTLPSSAYLYLLGVAAGKKQMLLKFDTATLSFEELKVPANCEVLAWIRKVHNYSSMVAVGPDKFLVCGGITANLQNITAKCFLLEPLTGKCEVVSPMKEARYTATTIYHDEHVYVFGGRRVGPDETAIMQQCERFSLLESNLLLSQTDGSSYRRCRSNDARDLPCPGATNFTSSEAIRRSSCESEPSKCSIRRG